MPLLVVCELSFRRQAGRGHDGGMHPWTGLADDVRLGVLTEWVSAELVDEVLAPSFHMVLCEVLGSTSRICVRWADCWP